MTLRTRRTTVLFLLLINILLLSGGIIAVLLLNDRRGLAGAHFAPLAAAAVATAALLMLFRYFRRSSIPEVFLTTTAMSMLGFESLRLLYPVLEIYNQPMLYFELTSRSLVFFQIGGLVGLFFVTLYLLGIQYQKVGSILWIQGIIALLFAYALPIRTGSSLNSHPVGGEYTYSVLLSGIAVLAVVNLISAVVQQRSLEGWRLYAGGILMIGGRLLGIVLPGMWQILGTVLLGTGLILFGIEQYQRYLWN